MKLKSFVILTVGLSLASCVSTKEIRPDGTVVETSRIDSGAIDSGGKFVTNVAPYFLSK